MLAKHWRQLAVCTCLWTITVALAVGGTARMEIRLMFWAVITALVACMVTGWLVAVCAATTAVRDERLDVEHLAEIMARVAAEERQVSRLPR